MTTKNILIIGSNYIAATILVRCAGFNDVCITVMDRKDPTVVVNHNQDARRLYDKYCWDLTYKDMMDPHNSKKFGDPKRNMEIKWRLLDPMFYEDWTQYVDPPDIIFNCSGIYDRLYCNLNPKSTELINARMIRGITMGINKLATKQGKKPLLVHMSSINVYGDQSALKGEKAVIDESTKPNPVDILGKTLLEQEEVIRNSNANYDYTILRLGTFIGYFTPMEALVNQAVMALLRQDSQFYLTNHRDESIELMDLTDFGQAINSLILMTEDPAQVNMLKNQVFNVKVEESEPKTIFSVVNSIYQMTSRLPAINGLKLRAPEIVEPTLKKLEINFADIPVSSLKFNNTFNYAANRPTVFSLVHSTVGYLLDYRISGMTEGEKTTFKKMFAIAYTPTAEVAKKEEVNQDVIDTVKDVEEKLEKM